MRCGDPLLRVFRTPFSLISTGLLWISFSPSRTYFGVLTGPDFAILTLLISVCYSPRTVRLVNLTGIIDRVISDVIDYLLAIILVVFLVVFALAFPAML
jgi:hypothetical protein